MGKGRLGPANRAVYGHGGGGGCFIATATMGNYNHPTVIILREFRDSYLLKNVLGKAFINIYYKLSPFFARIIEDRKILRTLSFIFIVKPLAIIIKKIVR